MDSVYSESDFEIEAIEDGLVHEALFSRPDFDALFDRLLGDWFADPDLRIQMLRFVDVLPVLEDDREILEHLTDYLAGTGKNLPAWLRWCIRNSRYSRRLSAALVRRMMLRISSRFLGGDDVQRALRTVNRLRRKGVGFSLDLLGEAVLSEQEAREYQSAYFELIDALAPVCNQWPPVPRLDRVDDRRAPRLYLSLKPTSIYSQISACDFDGSVDGIVSGLKPLFVHARERGVSVCLDMEQYEYKDIILAAFKKVLMAAELVTWPDAGIAMQAYLKDTESDISNLVDWTRTRGTPVNVRLVRGAYWDYETVNAERNDWDCPVWGRKAETDACFTRCTALLMQNYPLVRTAIATHNPRSVAIAISMAREYGLRKDQFEFQMLYGMGERLHERVAAQNYCLRVYVPYGDAIKGMAYLVRRLLENSSSQMHLVFGAPGDTGLAAGVADHSGLPQPATENNPARALDRFRNEPLRRFIAPQERQAFADAILQVRKRLGAEHYLRVNSRQVDTGIWLESRNPADNGELIGRVSIGGPIEAAAAIATAAGAVADWSRIEPPVRAQYLTRAADQLCARRDEFAALEILEAGKTWSEADANVCEAVDFLRFYAAAAVDMQYRGILQVPGEQNYWVPTALGAGVVISPWNFPLAILCGMVSAAVVTGNSVIVKPSSQTPVIASEFVHLLHAAGIPQDVVQFLPGRGDEIGSFLVRHPELRYIAFTGSESVGMRLIRQASQRHPQQVHIKRVVAEMGGKNVVIVDADADLDEAVSGIMLSAFGYQGQKCSACSRVIVVGSRFRTLIERLCGAAQSLRIGLPEDPAVKMGPVIDRAAQQRILGVIERAGKYADSELIVDCSGLETGHFVGPAIFSGADAGTELVCSEIFGPVLVIQQAHDIDTALKLANDSRYALTGGIYSRSPANIRIVVRHLEVGNLYINRGTTGAVVARQPFGGFKMSGSGIKAGCAEYLMQFVNERVATENTMRRGIAPRPGNFSKPL